MTKNDQNFYNDISTQFLKAGISVDNYIEYLGMNTQQGLLKESAACKYLNITKFTLLKFVKSGHIKRIILSPKTHRYCLDDLNEFIESHRESMDAIPG